MKSLKQLFAMICLALFILLVSSQNFLAQETKQPKEVEDENPTLEETFNWLKSKLEKHQVKFRNLEKGTLNYGAGEKPSSSHTEYQFTYSDFSLDGCTIKWKTNFGITDLSGSGDAPPSSSETFSTKLSKLDPLGIKVVQLDGINKYSSGTYKVISETISPEIWITVLEVKQPNGSPMFEPFSFSFTEREMAKRVVKAFQNAVKKCGGKVEPF